jgi:hypothetical protein
MGMVFSYFAFLNQVLPRIGGIGPAIIKRVPSMFGAVPLAIGAFSKPIVYLLLPSSDWLGASLYEMNSRIQGATLPGL